MVLCDDDDHYWSRSNTWYLSMRVKSLLCVHTHDDVMRRHIAYVQWARGRRITTYIHIHTYIHTYIHRYSKFAKCYSCIWGLLRLALQKISIDITSVGIALARPNKNTTLLDWLLIHVPRPHSQLLDYIILGSPGTCSWSLTYQFPLQYLHPLICLSITDIIHEESAISSH